MFTEEEAKQCWCHKTLVKEKPSKCLGSFCIAWKFTYAKSYSPVKLIHKDSCSDKDSTPDIHSWRGFCQACFEPVLYQHILRTEKNGICMDLKGKD